MIDASSPAGGTDTRGSSLLAGAGELQELLLATCSAVLEVAGDGRIVAVATAGGDDLSLALAELRGAVITDLLEDPHAEDGGSDLGALLLGGGPPPGHPLRLRIPHRPAIWVRIAMHRLTGPRRRILATVRPVDSEALARSSAASGRPLAAIGSPPAQELEVGGRRLDRGHHGAEPTLVGAVTPREAEMAVSLQQRLDEVGRLQRQVDDLLSGRRLFLSASAHELKTPLTILQVYLETLLDDLSEGLTDEQLSFLGICHESTLRLRRLVEDLVDLAALESGDIQLAFERVDLAPVIAAVVQEVEPLARHADVRLVTACAADIPPARTDPGRTRQVVRNLVDNAIRHTPPGGTVTVSTAFDNVTVRLTVHDTGVGIRADRLESILRGAATGRPATPGSGGGSGVGLAVSRRLVAALGGRLTGSSVEGEGSAFTVALPRWSWS